MTGEETKALVQKEIEKLQKRLSKYSSWNTSNFHMSITADNHGKAFMVKIPRDTLRYAPRKDWRICVPHDWAECVLRHGVTIHLDMLVLSMHRVRKPSKLCDWARSACLFFPSEGCNSYFLVKYADVVGQSIFSAEAAWQDCLRHYACALGATP